MSRLKFTQLAREDFQEIGDYIAKDNPIAAFNFVSRLNKGVSYWQIIQAQDASVMTSSQTCGAPPREIM